VLRHDKLLHTIIEGKKGRGCIDYVNTITTINLVRRLQIEQRRITMSGTLKEYNRNSLRVKAVCKGQEIKHCMPSRTKKFSKNA